MLQLLALSTLPSTHHATLKAMGPTRYPQPAVILYPGQMYLAMAMEQQKEDHQKPEWLPTRCAGLLLLVTSASMLIYWLALIWPSMAVLMYCRCHLEGTPPPFSRTVAICSFHALKHGIAFICSASNSGPVDGTVANLAQWQIVVAASTMDRQFPLYAVLGNKMCFKVSVPHPSHFVFTRLLAF